MVTAIDCRNRDPSMQGMDGQVHIHSLLPFACHRIIPVHKCALRIVAPGPDMQFEERCQVEPVRSANELEILTVERGWNIVVGCQPRGCVHNVLNPDQSTRVPVATLNTRPAT